MNDKDPTKHHFYWVTHSYNSSIKGHLIIVTLVLRDIKYCDVSFKGSQIILMLLLKTKLLKNINMN